MDNYRQHAFKSVFFKRQINKFKLKTIIKSGSLVGHVHAHKSFQSENFKADVVLDTDQLDDSSTVNHITEHKKTNHVKHNLWIWTQKPLEDVERES